jgi:drug/metabolite transporter (DMT)-like permease
VSTPVEEARPRPEEQAAVDPGATTRGILAVVLALVFPGLGHLYLGRRARSVLFAVLVLFAVFVGTRLDGNLYTPSPGHPLSYLATLGSMGMGIPYFLLLYTWHYVGDVTAAGFDYGTAFLLSAGLMNLLLALDAWDIATGRKD